MAQYERPPSRLVTRIMRGVIVCIVVMACFYGMASFFLLVPDSKSVQMKRRARQQMLDIRSEITHMEMTGEAVPMSVLDVLQHAERSCDTTAEKLSGIDPWGTPYLVEALRDTAHSTYSYRMNVRSFGPNRRDDLGKKDDLQTSTLGWVQVPPPMDPPRELREPSAAR